MVFQDLIIKKRDGRELDLGEIEYLVQGISDHSIPDYQVSAWAMAVFFQGMNRREIRDLSLAMARSGDMIDLSSIPGIKVDKHSTGGVGDKTTLVVVPLVAAAGIPVAKMSGRGLGHTGGTIDKFEAIPGFQVEKAGPAFIDQVKRIKAAVIAQSGNLVPADKRLYALRDVTGTVESIPLIASSIMSKKIASGAQAILLDVKVGQGAFMKDLDRARELARTMVEIGQGVGREVAAVISDMSQPLGCTVGNTLEVKEAIDTLRGHGPGDLEELCVYLAARMLRLGRRFEELAEAERWVREALKNGQGLTKLMEMVEAQGGEIDLGDENYGLPRAQIQHLCLASRSGFICELNAMQVGLTAMHLGAGRECLDDRIDHRVGVELCKKVGQPVKEGETLAIIHAQNRELIPEAIAHLQQAFHFSEEEPQAPALILDCIE
ncbi:MAG TPA: pyrimidine-nucleoside phosphorylase [Syntrophomonadaceae bacterium]|nr:pyrimidine-nucleoside phosphorylase [Syntrophomonadaceae bacterium]